MNSDTKLNAKQIDYSPLSAHVSLVDMLTTRGQFTNVQGAVSSSALLVGSIIGGTVVFMYEVIILLTTRGWARLLVVAFMIFTIVGAVTAIMRYISGNRAVIRLRQFAAQNGLQFMQINRDPPYQGMIFNDKLGSARLATNVMYSTSASDMVDFEIGNYGYTTGSGKDSQHHDWIYVRMKMDRNLPHIVLDAKANNHRVFGTDAGTNLPFSFTKDQILHLEGDFDKYFTLYAPKEYEDDAMYIFAPNVMAMLIDESSQFDAEIVDNEAYFYLQMKPGASLDDPNLMKRLIGIVTTLGDKLHNETEHYADDHLAAAAAKAGTGYVTTTGRSLKGTTWTPSAVVNTVIVLGVFFLFAILIMYKSLH